jgi:hypothetical protein
MRDIARRIGRLEEGHACPEESLGNRLEAAIERHKADPERAAREAEKNWRGLQVEFKAGRLSGLGLRLYGSLKQAGRLSGLGLRLYGSLKRLREEPAAG